MVSAWCFVAKRKGIERARSRETQYEKVQISVRVGKQSDVNHFINGIIKKFGVPDIALDDGGRDMNSILASFNPVYPRQDSHAMYRVEYLRTAPVIPVAG